MLFKTHRSIIIYKIYKVLKELKENQYPLDESLKLCKEYGLKKAVGYLLERSGAITDAIDVYFEVIIFF